MVTLRTKKDKTLHRLRIARGHLEKIITMVEADQYCIDILHQSLAVQKALKGIDMAIMEDHLHTCAVDQVKSGEEKRMVEELIGIYKYK